MQILVVSASPERAHTLWAQMNASQRSDLDAPCQWVSVEGFLAYEGDDVKAVLVDPEAVAGHDESEFRAQAVELVSRSTSVPLMRLA